jgi:hypothetical protein
MDLANRPPPRQSVPADSRPRAPGQFPLSRARVGRIGGRVRPCTRERADRLREPTPRATEAACARAPRTTSIGSTRQDQVDTPWSNRSTLHAPRDWANFRSRLVILLYCESFYYNELNHFVTHSQEFSLCHFAKVNSVIFYYSDQSFFNCYSAQSFLIVTVLGHY